MKGRILGAGIVSIAVLGLALAAFLRGPAPSAAKAPIPKPPVAQTPQAPDWNSHPLSSFRVHENEKPEGMDYKGVGYRAQMTPSGLVFETDEFSIGMAASRLEQGDRSIDLGRGPVCRSAFGRAHVDHQVMTEEYVFENSRVEQVFRIPVAIGTGALRVRTTVQTTLTGPVTDEGQAEWRESPFFKGGLAFRDGNGDTKLAYHSAVAIDAAGRRCPLAPRYDAGEIVLEVPAPFMASASWPVVIDPWLELNFSATGGGVSGTGRISQNIAMAVEGGGNPYVVWADDSSGDFEIYLRYWNGINWSNISGSDTGGGISNNAGNSTNPSICLANAGIYVAWEDDTSGNFEIYCKKWDSTSGQWAEMTGSASRGGVSKTWGESWHPSVGETRVIYPSRAYNNQPKTWDYTPIIAWEDTSSGLSETYVAFYHPGDAGIPNPGVPGAYIVYPTTAGWYGLNDQPNISNTAGGVSERPSLKVTSQGQPYVAWQDTQNGNYEIYLRYYSVAPPYYPFVNALYGNFGTWTEYGGSATGGGVSATASISQRPSLALSASGLPYIAWQETEAAGPNVWLRRWTGAAWAALGTSSSAGGISNTGRAAHPSLALNGAATPAVAVAWQDDTSGNPEIYVRQWSGAAWNEVGLAGSAAPATPEGISNTPTLSFYPVMCLDGFGNPIVAWADGANASFEVFLRRYYSNAPTLLRQTRIDNVTIIQAGGSTPETAVLLRCYPVTEILLPAGDPGNYVRMQVEVRPTDSEFVASPTLESAAVDATLNVNGSTADDVEAVIAFSGLPNTTYHWRARTVDNVGRASAWISFGGNADGQTDFSVTTVAPPPPTATPPPTNLTATAGNSQVVLNWTASTGPGPYTYNIRRSNTPGTETQYINAGAGTTYTDTGVTNGTTYYYVVRTLEADNITESINSNEVSATPSSVPGSLAGDDDDDKRHCGLLGAEALLLLGLLALIRRK